MKLLPNDTDHPKRAELLLASRRDVGVLETIYSCGLRISELCGLQAGDILFIPDSSGKRALRRAGDIGIALTTGVAVITAGKL